MVSSSFLDKAARGLSGTYEIDPAGSQIGFEARHAMITKVRGAFHDFAGTAVLDGENPALSKVELSIEVGSLSTGNGQRDNHLRTNDFFDVARFPQIRFVSTDAKRVKDNTFRLSGDLTIKGVTKPISVDFAFTGAVEDAWGNQCAGFTGTTVVNRKDWGVNFNAALEAGGVLVSEKATLTFDISAVQRADGGRGAAHTGRPIEEHSEAEIAPVVPGRWKLED